MARVKSGPGDPVKGDKRNNNKKQQVVWILGSIELYFHYVEVLRHISGVQKFDMGILCVDNRRIQRFSHIYRKKRQPTAVLAFPYCEVVTAHGICHLLGHRHETEEEWNEMQQKVSYILSEFNRQPPRATHKEKRVGHQTDS